MSNEYGFFASKNHDRRYSADDFSAFFGDFFTDGVLGSDCGALKVSAAGDMTVSIAAGTAYIKGRWYRRQSPQLLELSDSDISYDRIDAVVMRCDYVKRMVYPCIIEGIPEETPTAPSPVRNEECYDIVLAHIYAAANCYEITQADISDKRGIDELCGWVTSAIDHIDTTALFSQYDAQWELLKAACAKDAGAVISAWDALNTVKTVNGVSPVGSNVTLTQGLIPSDEKAYQFPYFVQSGTLVTESSVYNDRNIGTKTSITFPIEFKNPPLMFFSSGLHIDRNNSHYPVTINYDEVTSKGAILRSWYVGAGAAVTEANVPMQWIAFGEIDLTEGVIE